MKELKDTIIKCVKGRIAAMTGPIDVPLGISQPITARTYISSTNVQLINYSYLRKQRENLESALELVLKALSEDRKPELEKQIKDGYEQLHKEFRPK